MRKRVFDEPQFIGADGSNGFIHAHTDSFDSSKDFEEAAKKCAFEHLDEKVEIANIHQLMVRINPLDLDAQDGVGFSYWVMDLGPNAERKPGRFMAWKGEVA